MKQFRCWLWSVFGALLYFHPGSIGISQPIDQQNYSKVRFCNKSSDAVSLIVIHRHFYNTGAQMLDGWWKVSATECKHIGSFPRGSIWLYAKASTKGLEWKGSDTFACVAMRPTERTLFENEKCVEGEARLGFFVKSLNSSDETISISE